MSTVGLTPHLLHPRRSKSSLESVTCRQTPCPSPAMSLWASQGTSLSKAPLLCCKWSNDSTFQTQLLGEAEEAMCVKHFIPCLFCFLHLRVLVYLGCNNSTPQTAWLGDKENDFSQSGGKSPRASAGRFLAHRC